MRQQTQSTSPPGVRAAGPPLVDRARELDDLLRALDDALAGRGTLMMLEGEPGIGKTRLAEEVALRASARAGAIAVWGRCWESGGAPPYWPWIQALRDAVRAAGADAVSARAGPAAAYVATMMPGLADAFPSALGAHAAPAPALAQSEGDSADAARFRLFDATSTMLKAVAQSAPLVVVLDDLHAADPDSLLLLRFIARDTLQSRILILATYRSVEIAALSEQAALLEQIGREAHRVPVSGLNLSETAELIGRIAGVAPDPPLAAALHGATAGNPLFVEEIVRLMAAEQARPASGRGAPAFAIPQGVRAIVRQAMERLPATSRRALTVAAAVGQQFDVQFVRSVTGFEYSELADALAQVRSRGLIDDVPGDPGYCRFRHAVIREALRDETPAAERTHLHAAIARELESSGSVALEPRLAELAYHYVESLPVGPADKAVHYARLAAEQALRALAYAEAARLYELAIKALATLPAHDETSRCELMLGLSEAHIKAGVPAHARDLCLQAAAIARGCGRADLLARAAIGASASASTFFGVNPALIVLLEEAAAALGQSNAALRASVLARLARELRWSERGAESLPLAERAVELARESGDAAALMSALQIHHQLNWAPENVAKRLDTASEIMQLGERCGDIFWALKGREFRISALLEIGDVRRAELEIEQHAAREAAASLALGTTDKLRATVAMLSGDFDRAEAHAAALLRHAQRREDRALVHSSFAIMAMIGSERGSVGELEGALKASVAEFPALIAARCGLALYYARARRRAQARAEFEYLAAGEFARITRDWNWLGCIAQAAEVCAFLDDAARAQILYQRLRDYHARNVTLGWGDICYGSVSRYLAMLCRAMGRFDDARAHFDAALAFELQMGARPFVARTQISYAAMLADLGGAANLGHARALLDSALAITESAAMADLAAEAHRLRERIDAAPGPLEPAPDQAATRATSPPPISPAEAGHTATFLREGDYWTVAFAGGKVSRLKDVKGAGYIAHLLRNPNVEIHALDLITGGSMGVSADEPWKRPPSDEELEREGLSRAPASTDAGAMLDADAKAAYRRRLGELRDELDEAKEAANEQRIAAAEEEIDALARELARAVGRGGRDRRAASSTERARLSVSRAIKAAIARVTKNDPKLGAYLASTIRTGTFCSYRPNPRDPVSWRL